MRNCKLTPRERVQRMLERKDHDCVPRHESFWSDTWQRWREEGHEVDFLDVIGHDFGSAGWVDPSPFRGPEVVIEEDDTTKIVRDHWGQVMRLWKHRMGTPEHFAFSVPDRDTWFDTIKPLIVNNPPSVPADAARVRQAQARRNGRWMVIDGLETFEITRRLIGDELTMIGLIDDPEWIVDVSRTTTDATLRDMQYLLDNGIEPDGIWIWGDMAYRSGVISGPPLYRELIWPDHKRMVDWAHDRGLKFVYHTDGDVNSVLDDYVAAGFDMLHPLEAKCGMDVRNMAPIYGDRMALAGNVDIMILATNDLEQIEHEVLSKLQACMEKKAYVYHSDHSVPPSVNWETMLFVADLLDRHGNYD